MKRVTALLASVLLLASACASTIPRPNVPTPPVVTVPTISVLTVKVTGPRVATVAAEYNDTSADGNAIGPARKAWTTRLDNQSIIEEFPYGRTVTIVAAADGYETSKPVTVTLDSLAPYISITLAKRTPQAAKLSIVGRDFIANGALYVPRWTGELSLLTKTVEDQIARLDEDVAQGFNGIRVFAGALTWALQVPAQAIAELPGLLTRAIERGLNVQVTALTDTGTGYDAKAHVTAIADIVQPHKDFVTVELMNEIGHSSQDSAITERVLRQWGAEILAPRGILWSVGAMLETDEVCPPAGPNRPSVCAGYAEGEYPGHGGPYMTAHLDRGRDVWNMLRRVREIYGIVEAYRQPTLNNEAIGCAEPGTSGQRLFDPAYFYTLGVLDRAFSVGGVHHSQAALLAVADGPVQRECAFAYVKGHRDVESALPGRGDYKNVGHDGGPIASARLVNPPATGAVRIYSFIAGNRGVSVIVGQLGDPGIVWANGWKPVRTVGQYTEVNGRTTVVVEIGR